MRNEGSRLLQSQECVFLIAGLFDVQRFHDRTYPRVNDRKTKSGSLHCFGNDFVSFERIDIQEITVRAKHRVGHDKADSLVSIDEGVVVCQRFHQSGYFVKKVTVIAGLWAQNGGLHQPASRIP